MNQNSEAIGVIAVQKLIPLLLFVLLTPFSLGLFALDASAQNLHAIAVVVNGIPITEYDLAQHMDVALKTYMRRAGDQWDPAQTEPFKAAQRKPLLEKMVDDILLEEEVERLNIVVDPAQIDAFIQKLRDVEGVDSDELFEEELAKMNFTMKSFRKKIEDDMLKQRLIGGIVGSKLVITDTDIEQEFQKNPNFEGGERYHLRVIMTPNQDEMDKVIEEIEGGMSFAEAAKTHSTGPAAEEGGDMGNIALMNMAEAWRQALVGVEQGDYTDPFVADESYVLLQFVSTSSMSVDDIPGMREKIFNEIRDKKRNLHFAEYVERLRDLAIIEWK